MNRILLVEDEPELARAITRELKAEGYRVEHAADGLAALDAHAGTLTLEVDDATLAHRAAAHAPTEPGTVGRGIFAGSRARVGDAERGASTLFAD